MRIRNSLQFLKINADIDGKVYTWDKDLKSGEFVSKDHILGKIANLGNLAVEGFVPENDVEALQIGNEVYFTPTGQLEKVKGKIVRIVPIKDRVLLYPQLASVNKGPFTCFYRNATKRPLLVESYYLVVIELEETQKLIGLGQTGSIEYKGPWSSYFMRKVREILSLYRQEANV